MLADHEEQQGHWCMFFLSNGQKLAGLISSDELFTLAYAAPSAPPPPPPPPFIRLRRPLIGVTQEGTQQVTTTFMAANQVFPIDADGFIAIDRELIQIWHPVAQKLAEQFEKTAIANYSGLTIATAQELPLPRKQNGPLRP